ncbi:MAG TPA: DNA topoisomerase VI subunit B [Methanothrix sp.]|nr:DNA topoisomerase VI subunit B [Methanothrix sp.]HPC89360.1 DNA topoisomerase VI subunit B [Methanothrix sp.]HQE87243.1 DNA topoisomerase VI subunit B [Methanothrix sp.]HQI67295.1 DNA topoisomerase VI subunit B [Methanothrix sp.]HRS84278.1 DNA topoisomerase VI subunit B [Methanothrix sp.]
MEIAEELARQQKAISVAEFFEKNRQILGFDSAPRALITCVKEAVDNSLDACEDAGILPDIFVQIKKSGEYYQVIVEDNGPGIVPQEIPRVFAKLLYGSRFHTLRQSRGQQGIGISAAVLYSQLTSGKPTKVISKIAPDRPAHSCELLINTAKNEPEILRSEETDWERPRGTRVEMEMEGTYVRGRRQSVYGSLKSTAIVNPHARITLVEPEGNMEVFERATESLPKKAYAISPHPAGIELGELIKLLRYTDKKKLRVFLKDTFSSIGAISAQELCSRAGLDTEVPPASLDHEQAKRLHGAFKAIKVKSPPADCLSPIGEELIKAGLEKEYRLDYIATTVRPVSVYSGNPFLVEVGLGYGGELERESRVEILRFANRVPLVYQQGACAITHAVECVSWKNYSLGQPTGSGVPVGPAVLLVHIASTNIPFTSESKDAVADVPEILAEVDLGLKEVARKLRRYLSRQSILSDRREKEEIIRKILPRIAKKLSDVLEKDEPDIGPVVAKIMGNLLVSRRVEREDGQLSVKILVENHGDLARSFKLHELLAEKAETTAPEARVIPIGDGYDHHWKLSLAPGQKATLNYRIAAAGLSGILSLKEPVVEGLDAEIVRGARVI